jgi:hypothetical protein
MYNLQSFRLRIYVYVQRRAHARTLPALVQLHTLPALVQLCVGQLPRDRSRLH